jgi:hypothetical protein
MAPPFAANNGLALWPPGRHQSRCGDLAVFALIAAAAARMQLIVP